MKWLLFALLVLSTMLVIASNDSSTNGSTDLPNNITVNDTFNIIITNASAINDTINSTFESPSNNGTGNVRILSLADQQATAISSSFVQSDVQNDKETTTIFQNAPKPIIPHNRLPMLRNAVTSRATVATEVDEKLATQENVRVIVVLGGSKYDHATQDLIRNAVIEEIGQENIKYRFSSINAFAATVTQKELDQLRMNNMVDRIDYDKPVHASLQDSVPLINASLAHTLQYAGVNLTGKGQTVCVVDSGIDYTHPDLGDCTPGNNPIIQSYSAYSPGYPNGYANNLNNTLTITKPGYKTIAVHFTNLSVEAGYDYIDILDGNNNYIYWYTGDFSDLWSPTIPGDTIKIRLTSDDDISWAGYNIDETKDASLDWSECHKVIGGFDFVNLTTNPMDQYGHGTHVAGIIAAKGSINGVAPDASLIAARVLDENGSGYTSDIVAGIEYCTNNANTYNISVISLSIGMNDTGSSTYCDASVPTEAAAINAATAQGISVVIATGNEGSPTNISAPACVQNAIPVGATTKSDVIANYSNRNSLVQLVAPGGDASNPINSTLIGGGYIGVYGTSMAVPHVSGAIAILNQYLRARGQTKTPQQLETILSSTGRAISDAGFSNRTYSRIDIYHALLYLDDIPPIITITSPLTTQRNSTVLINVTVNGTVSPPSRIIIQLGPYQYIYNATNNTANCTPIVSNNETFTCTIISDPLPDNYTTRLNVTAYDSGGVNGNMNQANMTFALDANPPIFTNIVLSRTVMRTNATLHVIVNLTEAGPNVTTANNQTLNCTGATALMCTGNIIANQTSIVIQSTDLVGNVATNTTTITLDDIPPVVFAQGANETNAIGITKSVKLYANVTDNNGASNILNVSIRSASGPIITLTRETGDLWSVITRPIDLGLTTTNPAAIIVFTAYDNATNSNSTAATTLNIDASVPVVSGAHANITYVRSSTSINFSVFANDTSLVSVSMNGTTMNGNLSGGYFSTINTTAQFGCQGIEGDCTFVISAKDNVGNDNNSEQIIIHVDDLNPRVTNISINDTDGEVRSSQIVSISANVTDRNVTSVSINGTPLTATNGLYRLNSNLSALGCQPNAICTLTVVATDGAGNVNNTQTLQAIVDNTAPALTLSTPNNTWKNTLTPHLNYSFTDAYSANATCTLTIKGIAYTSVVSNHSTQDVFIIGAGLTDTNYTWTSSCTDQAGNTGTSETYTLGIDTQNPISTITLNQTSTWVNTPTLVNITATDIGSEVATAQWKNASSGAWMSVSAPFILNTNLSDNIIYYRSMDNAGNVEPEKQQIFQFDATPPNIELPSIGSNLVGLGETVSVSAKVTDTKSGVANVTFTLNGTSAQLQLSNGKYVGTMQAPVTDGTYQITLTANDAIGNVATDTSLTLMVNSSAPTMTASIPNGTTVENNTVMTLTFKNATNAWINMSTGVQTTNTSTAIVTITGEDGAFNVQVWANSSVGTTNQNYTYTIDSMPPIVTYIGYANNTQVNGTISITANTSDPSGIRNVALAIDGTTYATLNASPYTFAYPTVLKSDGLHTTTLTATDNLGHSNSTSVTFNITNNIPMMIATEGDSSSGSASIVLADLTNTPIEGVIYAINGLNSTTISLGLLQSAPYTPANSQLSTVMGIINITASTASTAKIYLLIPKTVLTSSGLTAPYSTIAIYADHGSGVVGPLTSGYDTLVTLDGVVYERFWFQTTQFSVFYWGIQGTSPVPPSHSGGGGGGGGSGGGSPPVANLSKNTLNTILSKAGSYAFWLDNQTYTLRALSMNTSLVTLSFQPTTITTELSSGENATLDLTGDGIDDIVITILSLTNTSVRIQLAKTPPRVSVVNPARNETEGATMLPNLTNNQTIQQNTTQPNTNITSVPPQPATKSPNSKIVIWMLAVLMILILIGLASWLMKHNKSKHKKKIY